MRKLFCFVILTALVFPAAAQDAAVIFRMPVPLSMPQIVVSPDGTTIAVYENPIIVDHEIMPDTLPIYLFDVVNGVERGRLEGTQTDLTRAAAFTPDGTRLISFQQNGELIVWDVETQTAVNSWNWLPMNGSFVDVTPDGSTAVLGVNGSVGSQQIYFDLTTGSIPFIYTRQFPTIHAVNEGISNIVARGTYTLTAQAINSQGQIVGATANGEVFLWNGAETVTLVPETEAGMMRFNLRNVYLLPGDIVVYFNVDANETVAIAPDGTQESFPFGSTASALSPDGTLAFIDRNADQIYIATLDADAPEPRALDIDFGGELNLIGQEALEFVADGNLVFGGIVTPGTDDATTNTIFVVDVPEAE